LTTTHPRDMIDKLNTGTCVPANLISHILIGWELLRLITSVPALLYCWHIPFKHSSFDISQWNRSLDIIVQTRSGNHNIKHCRPTIMQSFGCERVVILVLPPVVFKLGWAVPMVYALVT